MDLKDIIKDIEKTHGKESLASNNVEVDKLTTGCISVDIALGGGIPMGRIVEIVGMESSGKCLTKDSYILTKEGYKTIEQIFNSQGLGCFCSNKQIEIAYPLINKNNEVENTTHFTFNGKRPVFEIKTHSGFIHKCTFKHPLLCLSDSGNLVWKWSSEIKEGDYLVSIKNNNNFGTKYMSEDYCYMIGLFIADGSLQENRICITNDDIGVKNFIENTIPDLIEVSYITYLKNKSSLSVDYHFSSKEKINTFYKKSNLFKCISKEKYIPEEFMELNENSMSHFLCGYLDSEGYFCDHELEVCSASHKLLYQIKLILSQFSINSTLTEKTANNYPNNDYWRLLVSGDDYIRYIETIGRYSKSPKQINKMKNVKKGKRSLLNIPNIYYKIKDLYLSSNNRNVLLGSVLADIEQKGINCSYINLKKFLDNCDENDLNTSLYAQLKELLNYSFEKVKYCKQIEDEATFDFAMGKTHTFIADGCINHNTSLALHIAAEVQKIGKKVVYIDTEHALDPNYATNLGVDVDVTAKEPKFFLSQPDSGEMAISILTKFLKSNEIGLIVLDSVASLVPKARIQGEVGDAKMAIVARIMSEWCPVIASMAKKTNCIVLMINQYREKPGVVYGCLHGETRVVFDDGRSIPIKQVVDNKIEGNVWSYNESTLIFESKKILDWHNNGQVNNSNDYIHFQTNSIEGRGRFGFTVTPNHKVMTSLGWKEAKDIEIGDKILSKFNSILNNTLQDFLSGIFVGDSFIDSKGNIGRLNLQNTENVEYMNWKIEKLSKFIKFKKYKDLYYSETSYEFKKIKSVLGNRNPMYFFENYSDLGLAIWFMDDGHFDASRSDGRYRSLISVKRFKNDEFLLKSIVFKFKQLLDIDCSYQKDGGLRFNKENTDKIFNRICTYIPNCMQYKLHDNFKQKYEDFELVSENIIKEDYVNVVKKRFASDRQMRLKNKYDLSIEDNYNYLVGGYKNGIIVHNSPLYAPGGSALKFYASQRIEVARCGQNKEGDEIISNQTRIKVIKNKVAPPFKQAHFDIVFGKGVDKFKEVIDLSVEFEIIKKSGSWFSYGDVRLGQGISSVIELLTDNIELFEEIKVKVLSKIKENENS